MNWDTTATNRIQLETGIDGERVKVSQRLHGAANLIRAALASGVISDEQAEALHGRFVVAYDSIMVTAAKMRTGDASATDHWAKRSHTEVTRLMDALTTEAAKHF